MNPTLNAKTNSIPDAYSIALADFNVSDPALFQYDAWRPYFKRLREEDPVHYCRDSLFGPYWSVTRWDDVMEVDKNHQVYSSEDGITLQDRPSDFVAPSFIAMDPPKHDVQRKTVTGVVAPTNLALLEPIIRERAGKILDELPRNETFNWVDHVSIELTTQMLATLFDFPFEHRRKLTYWSDMATSSVLAGGTTPEADRRAALHEMLEWFTELWHERAAKEPGNDLVSMLAHGKETQDLLSRPMEYMGNLILLIVGGNDTTRNSISGGILALNENPDQYQKLRDNIALIPGMVSEIIRWQTPLAYMRRTAVQDTVLAGKHIRKGDKVAMWYISANRDESVIDTPEAFIIDREKPRHHMSFGYGIHRCMGNRLAEMQLRIVWEEITKRFHTVEQVGDAVRVQSSFVRGIAELPVRVHER
jgi:cytochrome P450